MCIGLRTALALLLRHAHQFFSDCKAVSWRWSACRPLNPMSSRKSGRRVINCWSKAKPNTCGRDGGRGADAPAVCGNPPRYQDPARHLPSYVRTVVLSGSLGELSALWSAGTLVLPPIRMASGFLTNDALNRASIRYSPTDSCKPMLQHTSPSFVGWWKQ